MFKGDVFMRSLGFVWDKLRRNFSESFVDQIKGMTFVKDHLSAVFDVPTKSKDMFLSLGKDLE